MLTVTQDRALPTAIAGSYPLISTDCGFGCDGPSRRIACYNDVSMVEAANIMRQELGLPDARVRASDPKLWSGKR